MAVAIVTDSTHYLPADVVKANGLHTVSLYVRWGDTQQRESDMLDLRDFYDQLRAASDLPTTSQPSIGDFLECYEPLLEAGHDIVSIHLSAGISGTYDAALQAAGQLAEAGNSGRIEVVDSRTVCGSLGLVLLAAAARVRAGETSPQAVAEHALRAREAMRMWFIVDTLEYLRRGGRIGGAQAWVGSALKIKPIMSMESTVTPVERVRTAGRAFERMVEFMRTLHADGADAWCVQHSDALGEAQRMIDRGREIFGCEPLFLGQVGPVIGAHAGPGIIGIGAMPVSALG